MLDCDQERKYSSVYDDFDVVRKMRYREKLDRVGKDSVHTYLPVSDDRRLSSFPGVEYPDVYKYPVNSPRPYTKEAWVGDVSVFRATLSSDLKVFVSGKVRHSHSVSTAPLRPWVAAEADGTVVCAHCTCMAGPGEACSYLAALLFWLEANNRLLEDASFTSVPCQWSAPKMQNDWRRRINDIDFASPEYKMRH